MENFVKPNSLSFEEFLKIKEEVEKKNSNPISLTKKVKAMAENPKHTFIDSSDEADYEFEERFNSEYRGDISVIRSIKERCEDYCYRLSYLNTIIEELTKAKKSCIYQIKYNEYGEFDYIHFLPARFSIKSNMNGEVKEQEVFGVYEIFNIPKNTKCVAIHDHKARLIKEYSGEINRKFVRNIE